LAALADGTRKAVVDLLSKQPRRAGELAATLSMSPAAMSRHLRVLRRSGIIGEAGVEEDARVRVYHLRREPFDELRRWVEEVETFWGGELASFKEHVDRRGGRGSP
jgi:DNA-binding transcriptional ArsR family regulator